MKSSFRILGLLVIISIFSYSFVFTEHKEKVNEEETIKKLVYEAYINGAFNGLDTESMAKGFHKDFAIYSAKGEEISKYKISDWVSGVKKRRADNYDPTDPKNVWKHNFASVDVTGGAAQVKVELMNRGNHVYTDYLSLLKFESGWKIVGKVYHRH